MKKPCPNSLCYFYYQKTAVIHDGNFKRNCDSRIIRRFKCKNCGKRFSTETFKLEYYQKKRRINGQLLKLLSSGVSLRRSAILLNTSRRTIEKKLHYLGKKCRFKNKNFGRRFTKDRVRSIQIDDLITKENSKLKPLSVSIAVDEGSRRVLGAEVSQIPAFGHLTKVAIKKYGIRPCKHQDGLNRLCENISHYTHESVVITSDEHKKYLGTFKRYFPRGSYLQYKSERACVAGQGELKKVNFDPLFLVNHTCAMFRANINRLIRKTWCTTKSIERLKDHIDIFIHYHNTQLIRSRTTPFK